MSERVTATRVCALDRSGARVSGVTARRAFPPLVALLRPVPAIRRRPARRSTLPFSPARRFSAAAADAEASAPSRLAMPGAGVVRGDGVAARPCRASVAGVYPPVAISRTAATSSAFFAVRLSPSGHAAAESRISLSLATSFRLGGEGTRRFRRAVRHERDVVPRALDPHRRARAVTGLGLDQRLAHLAAVHGSGGDVPGLHRGAAASARALVVHLPARPRLAQGLRLFWIHREDAPGDKAALQELDGGLQTSSKAGGEVGARLLGMDASLVEDLGAADVIDAREHRPVHEREADRLPSRELFQSPSASASSRSGSSPAWRAWSGTGRCRRAPPHGGEQGADAVLPGLEPQAGRRAGLRTRQGVVRRTSRTSRRHA